MSPELESARARRYLLGQGTEEERAALEQEYFHSDAAVDRVAAAEDDLIEDYLSGSLDAADRGLFEREYLSTPRHRQRVETIRQLRTSASRTASGQRTDRSRQWLALAATLLLVAAGSVWLFISSPSVVEQSPPIVSTAPGSPTPSVPDQPSTSPPAASRVFAVSISPVGVRSAAGAAPVILPANADIVVMNLEGEPERRSFADGRASIRTVGDDEIWRGTTAAGNLPAGAIARIEVPATRLPPDDYVITLFGTDAGGHERERARYFLRVRAR
jgi:hypothetical protein